MAERMDDTNEIDSFLIDLGQALKLISDYLQNKAGLNQKAADVLAGVFRYPNGIVIPIERFEHRFNYDYYELILINSYGKLFLDILQSDSNLAVLAIRILFETGVSKCDILFSSEVQGEELTQFRLIHALTDLALMREKYSKHYLAIFDAEKTHLPQNCLQTFDAIATELRSGKMVPSNLLRQAKAKRQDAFRSAKQETNRLPHLGRSQIDNLVSSFSELLHGNPLSIEVLVTEKHHPRGKNWTRAALWLTGMNVLYRLESSVEDESLKKRIAELIAKADSAWRYLAKQIIEDNKKNR